MDIGIIVITRVIIARIVSVFKPEVEGWVGAIKNLGLFDFETSTVVSFIWILSIVICMELMLAIWAFRIS